MSTFCDILCVRLAALRKRLLLIEDAELIDDVIRELRDQQHEIEADNELLSGVVIRQADRIGQ